MGYFLLQELYEKLRTEFEKVQQSYSDALDKISSLQIELEIQVSICSKCKVQIEKSKASGSSEEVSIFLSILYL